MRNAYATASQKGSEMKLLVKRLIFESHAYVGPLVFFVSGLVWLYLWRHLLLLNDKLYFFALLVLGVGLLCMYVRLFQSIHAKLLKGLILAVIAFPLVVLLGQEGGGQLLAILYSGKAWYIYPSYEALYFLSSLLTCAELIRIHVKDLGHTLASHVMVVAEAFLIAACGFVVFIYSP